MRRLYLLFFLALPFFLNAQFPQHGKYFILFRNHSTYKLRRLTEKERTYIEGKNAKVDFGVIKSIRQDSIFINDNVIKVWDIHTLSSYSALPFTDDKYSDKNRASKPWYDSDDKAWEILIPPDSIYKNPITVKRYINYASRFVKNEKLQYHLPLKYRNFIKLNVSKMIHLEIMFAYERYITRKFYWETEAGYVFGTKDAAYYMINYPLYSYNGISVTTFPKFYFNNRSYWGPVLMYKYLWFKEIRTGWPDHNENGILQDQYRNDLGVSLRYGFMRSFGGFIVDLYAGLGIKGIWIHQLAYAHYMYHDSDQKIWYNKDHSPVTDDFFLVYPVINMGIKIGLGF